MKEEQQEEYKQELKRINSMFKRCKVNPKDDPTHASGKHMKTSEIRKMIKSYENKNKGFRYL